MKGNVADAEDRLLRRGRFWRCRLDGDDAREGFGVVTEGEGYGFAEDDAPALLEGVFALIELLPPFDPSGVGAWRIKVKFSLVEVHVGAEV